MERVFTIFSVQKIVILILVEFVDVGLLRDRTTLKIVCVVLLFFSIIFFCGFDCVFGPQQVVSELNARFKEENRERVEAELQRRCRLRH